MNLVKAMATASFGNLYYVYDGTAKTATVSTIPSGVATVITYNGYTTPPTNAGSYAVQAVINDPNYQGSTIAGTLTIAKASAGVYLGNLNFTYDGTAKPATVGTNPSGLGTFITYNGSSTAPTTVGTYPVLANISDSNYQGSASGTLTIAYLPVGFKNSGLVLNRATKTYNGTLTVTNTGAAAIAGTLTVELDGLTAGVTAVNPARMANGAPQLDKALSAPLNPGQSVSIALQFNDPANAPINFNPIALQH